MSISFEERTYRLSGISPLLGSWPANEDLVTQFVLSKCPDDKEDADENHARTYDQEEGRVLTVFPVGDNDEPVLLAYQVKGFFKEIVNLLRPQNSIGMPKKKVDNYLFIDPDVIYIYRNDKRIEEADDRRERPLRAERRDGTDQNVLASSERINDPWEIEFTVLLTDNEKPGTRSQYKPLTWENVEDALDYGKWKGIGQWRNGGWGRFTWERVS